MSASGAARSAQMALIRGKDTKPEIRVRKALYGAGLRYRIHYKGLPGSPDVVFPTRRIALFVNGCFFHQHPGCRRARMPKSRPDFWGPKLSRNVERDQENNALLTTAGWNVITVWECETELVFNLEALVQKIKDVIPTSRRQLSVTANPMPPKLA